MSFYKKRPWDPGYSTPGYVDGEPTGRGTFTTAYLPRRTISDVPQSIEKGGRGYSLPKNVLDEPLGRGTITTQQLKRRSISQFVPDYLSTRGPGDTTMVAETPGMSGFGTVELEPAKIRKPGYAGDPISTYGRDAAALIMKRLESVPQKQRTAALRGLFEKIDPQLWTTVAQKAEWLEQNGESPRTALQKAMAASLSDGLMRELVHIGLTGSVQPNGHAGLAAFGCAALGDTWDDIGNFAKDAGNAVGRVGCRVLNSPAAPVAAGIGAQAAGIPAPVGATGAQLAAAACGPGGSSSTAAATPKFAPVAISRPTRSDAANAYAAALAQQNLQAQYQQQYAPPPPQSSGLPLMPIAIGGAAILAIMLLRRK